jgi:hypothetical protein
VRNIFVETVEESSSDPDFSSRNSLTQHASNVTGHNWQALRKARRKVVLEAGLESARTETH